MDYAASLLALMIVDVLAVVSPGPNFLIVTGSSMRQGRSAGLFAVLGILSANLVWVLGALLGLTLLFELVPWLYGTVKILGGCYLVYLGVQYWRAGAHASGAASLSRRGLSRPYAHGFLTGLTNPKSLVYFGSVFTLFVGPSSPVWVDAVAVAIVLFNGALWYGGVAVFFGSARVQRVYLAVEKSLNRAAGAVMAGFGVRLLWERE